MCLAQRRRGSHLHKRHFSQVSIQDIVQQRHLYHPQRSYQSFAEMQRS
ncbi:hypothetical protein CYA_2288 [Synechococcus sp. JA-3-3Ab]|nr:hypothetical protein CYA_2288 [Synechococcus sp. JA-3-3Ab]